MPAPQQLYHFASANRQPGGVSGPRGDLGDLRRRGIAGLKALSEAGCTYVQMDRWVTSCLCDANQRSKLGNRGDDPDRVLSDYIKDHEPHRGRAQRA